MEKNNFVIAFQKTLLLFATLHLVIIAIEAFRTRNFSYLHMANILDLNFFFPTLQYTPLLGALLLVPVLIVFLFHYSRARVGNKVRSEKAYSKK